MTDIDPGPVDIGALRCGVALEYSDRLNFAMQQNGVPLVEAVRVTSESDEAIEDVTVELSVENGDAEPWSVRLSRLDPGGSLSVVPDGFSLAARALATRTEAERSSIVCRVSSAGAAIEKRFAVDLLAFDQWPGIGYSAELTAAFVTPNHPRVAELLGGARRALGGMAESDALDGYQSGSRQRAALIAEACFNAVAGAGIGYINPPASFETQGQRVRLVDRVLRERFGTCLDLSFVLAAMWEQCGLHPLVLFPEGHAMPAVWTHAAHLPEAAIDEPARIRNLVELGEIVPIESTHVTQSGATFAGAVESAKARLRDPGAMFHAVDVRSARKHGVRPLPLRDDGESGVDLGAVGVAEPVAGPSTVLDRVALAERAERVSAHGDDHERPADRIARWETRLLDLSLRNRLLNFRPTGRTLSLDVPDLAAFEDGLADGGRFTVLPRADGSEAYLREELAAGHVHSDETKAETDRRLLTLYRTARSSIEETGANVLYVALGMLRWFEGEDSDHARLAPLVLLPATLVRTSAGGGYAYSLRLSDEPARPNVTLLEKLRVDFGVRTDGLDELPEDERGLDVALILRNFRAAIRESSRWEVAESAVLGLFSFNKFLMWKDLRENADRLKLNRLVSHLVERPGQDFDPEPFPVPDELDASIEASELLCTRDADSTQLAAVRAASQGRTFVLEGPPGTGKSQTIANIITDSLAHGRRVLFVAEKMAALSVVRRRLEEDGLGPFCLELHSAKASKKEVLAQLEAGLAARGRPEPASWDGVRRDLAATREDLNTYVRALHEPRGIGESLYGVLGRLSTLDDGPAVGPEVPSPSAATPEDMERWRRLLDDVRRRGAPVDPVGEHPLRGIGASEWSFALPDEGRRVLGEASGALGALSDGLREAFAKVGVELEPGAMSRRSVETLVRAFAEIVGSPCPPVALMRGPDAAAMRERVVEAAGLGQDRDARRRKLLHRYREEFLEIDPLGPIDAVQRHLKQPGVVRAFTAGGVRKPLRVYARVDLPSLREVLLDLEEVLALRRITGKIEGCREAAEVLGASWKGGEADWAAVEAQARWAGAFSKLLGVLDADAACDGVGSALAEAASDSARVDGLRETAERLAGAWSMWGEAWAAVESALSVDPGFSIDDSAWLSDAEAVIERWAANLGGLNTWVTWRAARDAAVGGGLRAIVAMYEGGGCTLDGLHDVFWRGFGPAWFNETADGVAAIRGFNAEAHRDRIASFRGLDTEAIRLTRDVVSARLGAASPTVPENASSQSEIGILRRELAKKRRHMPTRRLIEALPTLLPRLKPCFLMSPLSVAQFLDAELPPFDVVVFDEASQIPVWDSVGAMARGAEVIVVGDSKQLPPTSFFSTIDGEDDDEVDDRAVEDMESILNECNASGIPSMRLGWHYRSRHETLIAFSNHHYYRNELQTFPSPEERSESLGVTFRHVPEGVYDRGGTRTNRVEAERVVDEVVRLLRDPDDRDSIGVVTFNLAQQTLIEDLLDERRRAIPALDEHFSGDAHEPVFVKNLENVQGDERDTIIFSVGYGLDRDGRASMNFGPLNKDGGERRLNVAVTRARRRLMVFSSLTSDQIDVKRTRAVGVRDFKSFLEYAERGPSAIAEVVSSDRSPETDAAGRAGLESAVRSALIAAGFEVDASVGCAGYRIDLAVRHPERPRSYVLGIECDGPAYRDAKTARDRDRLRLSVLEGLGWRVERVWSTEWRVNREGCLARLYKAIEDGVRAEREAPGPRVAAEPFTDVVVAAASDRSLIADGPNTVDAAPEPVSVASDAATYVAADLARYAGFEGDVFDDGAGVALSAAISEIVSSEAPVTRNLVLRRLAAAFDVKRVTERVRGRFDEALDRIVAEGGATVVDDVVWSADQDSEQYAGYRVPGDEPDSHRDIDDVPAVEVSNAVTHVLSEQFGLPRDELVREVARVFGIRRATARVAERIDGVIDGVVASGEATEIDGRVQPTG